MNKWAYFCVAILFALCLYIGYAHVSDKAYRQGRSDGLNEMFYIWDRLCVESRKFRLDGVLYHCGEVKKL